MWNLFYRTLAEKLGRLFSRGPRWAAKGANHKRRFRPYLEALEDRAVPALTMVTDLPPPHGELYDPLVDVNGQMFFVADDGVQGRQLWVTDGSPEGTQVLTHVNNAPYSAYYFNPSSLTSAGDRLFFTAIPNLESGRQQLWVSDGTEAGTRMVTDLYSYGLPGFGVGAIASTGDTVFFEGYYDPTNDGNPSIYSGLFKTDSAGGGLTHLAHGLIMDLENAVNVNGTLFFQAVEQGDQTHGWELWKSDGTAAGTQLVEDLTPGAAGSSLADFTNVNGTLFFSVTDYTSGPDYGAYQNLWKSDGTAAGTTLVKEFAFLGAIADAMANVNGTLFFAADDGVSGYELWKSDGTAAGTTLVKDIAVGVENFGLGSMPSHLMDVDGTLFFAASDEAYSSHLWKSDGTEAGTTPVGLAALDWGNMFLRPFASLNGALFFGNYDPDHGNELWRSDGTAAGTGLAADVNPGPDNSIPFNVGTSNDAVFFIANDGAHGYQLWSLAFPTASAGGPYAIEPGQSLTLDAAGSVAPDGGPLSYSWTINGQAGVAAGATPTLTWAQLQALGISGPGSFTIQVRAADSQGTWTDSAVTSLTVTPLVASQLHVSAPAATTAGASFTVTVTAVNAYGIVVPDYRGTLRFTSSDKKAVLPVNYAFTAADNGSHAFRVTLKTAASQAITIADAVTPGINGSAVIAVSPAVAKTLGVTGFPASVAGAARSFTVTARDAYGNTATAYRGTVRFTSSDPQASLPADYTFTAADAGVHTFTATLRTAGSQFIAAKDTLTGTITGKQSNIKISAAAASILALTGFPSPTSAGAAGAFTVTARDPYGNIATGYRGTVRFSSTDAAAVLPAQYAFTTADKGRHTFSATLNTPGTHTLTALDTVLGSLLGEQAGIEVG